MEPCCLELYGWPAERHPGRKWPGVACWACRKTNPSTEEDSWRPSWRGWRSLNTWARTLTLCSRLSASPSVQHCSTSCSKAASTLPLALSCSIIPSMPPLRFASGSSRTSAMQSHTRKLKMAHTVCWSVQSSGHRWSQLRKWSWSWRWSQLCRWLWIPLRRRVSACCSNLNSRHPLSESWTPTDDNQIHHVGFIYHFLYNLNRSELSQFLSTVQKLGLVQLFIFIYI